ncbi:Small ribosomal subunit protein [Trichinella spiralis]|uniref:Small ribosomal subunit protein n=1 Tax=Trichinella spiralis TaxID=6334 RepID=A0ABR3KQ00_TRISP
MAKDDSISQTADRCRRWMGKKVGDSTRSIQIQCADGVVIHAHIGRNLADVYVRSNWLEPDLWLGYPDHTIRGSKKIVQNKLVTGLIAPELLSSHLFLKEFT